MKQQLCLENNYQTGKFEETTLFTEGRKKHIIYIYIYIYIRRGPQLKKDPRKKKKKKMRREKGKNVFSFTYEPQERFICSEG